MADLLSVVEGHEQIHDDIGAPSIRLRYFRQAQPAFDELIALQVQNPQTRDHRALMTSERSRSRFLRQEMAPEDRDLDKIRRRFPAGLFAIEFVLLPQEIVAWVVDRTSSRCVRITRQPAELSELNGLIRRLRRDLERGAPEATVVVSASALFARLIDPLELPWQDVKFLLIVPDRLLSEIPFAVLFDEDRQRYLVETVPVAIASALALLRPRKDRRRPGSAPSAVLVVGHPDLSASSYGDLPDVPSSAEEARRVAELYGTEPLLRQCATRRRFLDRLPQASLVHFAGHALANSERPERSILPLTPEEEGESVLMAQDLWAYELEGLDLVVLSACGTMAGHGDGREALFGMAGGFFAAGAREVVATHWPTEDARSIEIMARFHERYLEVSNAADALRAAVVDLRRSDPHGAGAPSHWAAFSVLISSIEFSE